jgi:hypothetical protein
MPLSMNCLPSPYFQNLDLSGLWVRLFESLDQEVRGRVLWTVCFSCAPKRAAFLGMIERWRRLFHAKNP